MSFRMGPLEIGIILVIIFIVFGVGKLPQVSEAIGRGLSSLRHSRDDDKDGEDIAPDRPKLITKLDDGDAPQKPDRDNPGGAG